MIVKIIDNVSTIQQIPSINSQIFRDISKPLCFYVYGEGSGQWSATITLYEISLGGYIKIGSEISLNIDYKNKKELYSWGSDTRSFLIRVSSIQNAVINVYMTQAQSSSLERILLSEPSYGTKANPADTINCDIEYSVQGWTGNLGVFDSETILKSLPTNSLVPGKVWAIVATGNSFSKHIFMSNGWILENSIGFNGYSDVIGSITNPFSSTNERDTWAANNFNKLYPMYSAYITGGIETKWIGPAANNWFEVQYVPKLVTREAAVVRISGDGTAEPALGDLVNANMQVPYYGITAGIIDREYYYIDLNHDYVDGTDLTPHIHLTPINTIGGNVKFNLYYQVINGGGIAPTPILLTNIIDIGTVAWSEKRINFTIPGTGITFNSRIMLHFFRNRNDVEDTYEAAVAITSISAHYLANPAQLGS